MRLKTRLTLLALAVFSATSITAVADSSYAKRNNNPEATMDYWTPERLQAAQSKDLPLVDPKQVKEIKLDFAPSVTKDGAPPTVKIPLDHAALFHNRTENKNDSLKNVGSRGLHFSSSRLVPLSADVSYPYTTVGKLFFTEPGAGDFVCSASVIANRLVVTAGHCVHKGSDGTAGFFTNWLFIPAFRDNTAPLQRWVWSFVNTTDAWMTGGGRVPNAGDFAILEMKDNVVGSQTFRIGDVTGKLGFATNKLAANHLHMLGYPCNFDACQKMHQVTAQNGPGVAPNNVMYGSDMRGGSSGGPWVQNFGIRAQGQAGGLNPGLNQVVAVTSWGFTSTNDLVQGAANFNSSFMDLFNQLCAHQAGNC